MAPRSFWKGYLKLSLVTCPVAMVPATSATEKVRFHTLNRASGNRVVTQFVDAVTGEPVEEDNEVKGYQTGEEDYVLLEDEEIKAADLESSRTIDIEMFVPHDSIDWIWLDSPHYLTPDDAIGEEAFSVIRAAMQATGMVGISHLVTYRRERVVCLMARERGIVLWTLRFGDEIRNTDDYFRSIEPAAADPDLLQLIEAVIEEKTKPWDPAMVRDPVQERLLEIIAARQAGRKKVAKPEPAAEPQGNVINIMDALRRSLAADAGAATTKGSRKR